MRGRGGDQDRRGEGGGWWVPLVGGWCGGRVVWRLVDLGWGLGGARDLERGFTTMP